MSESRSHDVTACARAWQTLRLAHDRVARRLAEALTAECGLAIHEFDVLLYLRLRESDQVRIGALLDAVPLSQPALSRLVDRLEARDLLRRSGATDDGRAVFVCLTETGTRLIEHAIDVHARTVHAALTSKFSDDEQEMLLQTLSRIGE